MNLIRLKKQYEVSKPYCYLLKIRCNHSINTIIAQNKLIVSRCRKPSRNKFYFLNFLQSVHTTTDIPPLFFEILKFVNVFFSAVFCTIGKMHILQFPQYLRRWRKDIFECFFPKNVSFCYISISKKSDRNDDSLRNSL